MLRTNEGKNLTQPTELCLNAFTWNCVNVASLSNCSFAAAWLYRQCQFLDQSTLCLNDQKSMSEKAHSLYFKGCPDLKAGKCSNHIPLIWAWTFLNHHGFISLYCCHSWCLLSDNVIICSETQRPWKARNIQNLTLTTQGQETLLIDMVQGSHLTAE